VVQSDVQVLATTVSDNSANIGGLAGQLQRHRWGNKDQLNRSVGSTTSTTTWHVHVQPKEATTVFVAYLFSVLCYPLFFYLRITLFVHSANKKNMPSFFLK